MKRYVVCATAFSMIAAFAISVSAVRSATLASRNLLTTEYRNNVPSVTLRGPQLSAVVTSILPFENIGYYQGPAGFFFASVKPIVGSAYDAAACSVTSDHALCTDKAAGSNAVIDILADPKSEYVGNYRTFVVTYRARDPRANSYMYYPVRNFALSIVFADNGMPQSTVQQAVYWMAEP